MKVLATVLDFQDTAFWSLDAASFRQYINNVNYTLPNAHFTLKAGHRRLPEG